MSIEFAEINGSKFETNILIKNFVNFQQTFLWDNKSAMINVKKLLFKFMHLQIKRC